MVSKRKANTKKSVKKTTRKSSKPLKPNLKKIKAAKLSSLKTIQEKRKEIDGSFINLGILSAVTEKGTCYLNYHCTGNVVSGGKITALECMAAGGKSWKGDYQGASCINGLN